MLTPASFGKARAAPAKARVTPARKRREARESSSDDSSGESSHHFKFPGHLRFHDHVKFHDLAPSLPSFLVPPEHEALERNPMEPKSSTLNPKYL